MTQEKPVKPPNPTVEAPRLTARMLAELPLFEGESPEALEWLLECVNMEAVPAGTVLLTPAESNSTAYIVLTGRLAVQLERAGEAEVHTYLEQGACVGEMSIIEGAPPSATVVADTDCHLLCLDGHVLWSLINRSHAVARNLLFTFSRRMRDNNQAIVESRAQQRLHERTARIDPLTNLGNRRWLAETLPRLLERCHMNGLPLTVLMVDVDHFKRYNDTLGHLAGDCALRAVAEVIEANVRPTDAAARYGGEEFAIVMPETDAEQARAIAQRLCDAVRRCPIHADDGRRLPGVTVSIGLADTRGRRDAVGILGAADAALYQAKQRGRDRVESAG